MPSYHLYLHPLLHFKPKHVDWVWFHAILSLDYQKHFYSSNINIIIIKMHYNNFIKFFANYVPESVDCCPKWSAGTDLCEFRTDHLQLPFGQQWRWSDSVPGSGWSSVAHKVGQRKVQELWKVWFALFDLMMAFILGRKMDS